MGRCLKRAHVDEGGAFIETSQWGRPKLGGGIKGGGEAETPKGGN